MRTTSTFILLFIVFSSCTKQKEAALRDNLIGTWIKYKVAWDNNNNERADAKEMEEVPSYLSQSLTFSGEGSGAIIRNAPRAVSTSTFTWAVTDKDHVKLTIMANGHATETEYEIARLKGNELTFKTATPSLRSDVAWEYYRRH